MKQLHRLLKNQLDNCSGSPDRLMHVEKLFIEAVNTAYWQFEEDRTLLERVMERKSKERMKADAGIRAVFQALPDLLLSIGPGGTVLDSRVVSDLDLLDPLRNIISNSVGGRPADDTQRKFHYALKTVDEVNVVVRIRFSLEGRDYEGVFLPAPGDGITLMVRRTPEHREALRLCQVSDDLLYRAVGQSPVATFVGLKGRIVFGNQAAATLLGAPDVVQLLDRSLVDAVKPEKVESFEERIRKLTDDGSGEVLYRENSGKGIWMEASPLVYNGSPAVQFVAYELIPMESIRTEEMDVTVPLEQLSSREALFDVSHEMKILSDGILGLTDVIFEIPLTPEQRQCAENLKACSSTLNRSLEGILNSLGNEAKDMI